MPKSYKRDFLFLSTHFFCKDIPVSNIYDREKSTSQHKKDQTCECDVDSRLLSKYVCSEKKGSLPLQQTSARLGNQTIAFHSLSTQEDLVFTSQ